MSRIHIQAPTPWFVDGYWATQSYCGLYESDTIKMIDTYCNGREFTADEKANLCGNCKRGMREFYPVAREGREVADD